LLGLPALVIGLCGCPAEPSYVEGCLSTETEDCAGTCWDQTSLNGWVGDGQCDDGSVPDWADETTIAVDLNCGTFSFDGGDCGS